MNDEQVKQVEDLVNSLHEFEDRVHDDLLLNHGKLDNQIRLLREQKVNTLRDVLDFTSRELDRLTQELSTVRFSSEAALHLLKAYKENYDTFMQVVLDNKQRVSPDTVDRGIDSPAPFDEESVVFEILQKAFVLFSSKSNEEAEMNAVDMREYIWSLKQTMEPMSVFAALRDTVAKVQELIIKPLSDEIVFLTARMDELIQQITQVHTWKVMTVMEYRNH
jgi:hypothetical protein